MKYIHGIAADDNAMKALFDHVRNLGICGAVFAAAAWKIRNADAGLLYFDWAIAGFLILLGTWLFMLNQAHGLRKLREAGMSQGAIYVWGNIYSLVSVTIMASLVIR